MSPSIGLVVGATDVPALAKVRGIYPNAWILCPGVGAQGGTAEDVCRAGLREDGSGILVSVSRGISGAADIPAAATKLRDDINALRTTYPTTATLPTSAPSASLKVSICNTYTHVITILLAKNKQTKENRSFMNM